MAAQQTMEQKADRLFQFIYDHLKEHAMSPSHRQMCEELGCSTETIQKALNLLEEQGRPIKRVRGRGRQVWIPINQATEED